VTNNYVKTIHPLNNIATLLSSQVDTNKMLQIGSMVDLLEIIEDLGLSIRFSNITSDPFPGLDTRKYLSNGLESIRKLFESLVNSGPLWDEQVCVHSIAS
jgi:hypothetical protein